MTDRVFRIAGIGRVAAIALALASPATASHAQDKQDDTLDSRRMEVLREWDAYYSSVGLYVPLTEDPFPDGGQMKESQVYRELFERSFHPNVLILEASVNPMPMLGVWMRREHPDGYDDATVGGGRTEVNIVQSVTAGFQEPWAMSVFTGSQMKFSRPGETERATNRGYMGYLVSVGKKHIKDNIQIDDDWAEVEWKMKGERIFRDERLTWSFRVGGKFNRNGDIADTVYLGISRSSLNFRMPFLSFLDNSRINLFTEIPNDHLTLLRQEIIFGKKYPIASRRLAWELDFGVIYEHGSKYAGELSALGKTSYTLVLRPNLVF
jgi:hypothetical protein